MKGYTLELKFNGYEGFRFVRSCVREFISSAIPDSSLLMEVAVNEAVNNAIKHGCVCRNSQQVLLRMIVRRNTCLIVRVKDYGHGFNASEMLAQKDLLSAEDEILSESGRGILIMEAAADLVKYNKAGNEVMLIKKLDQC